MKKNIIIASLAALACAAVVATFALGGAGKFGDVRANADAVEHSVTFNAGNTSHEVVDVYGDKYIAFTTTTDNGNKVGMVGSHYEEETSFTFNGASFGDLSLCDYDDVLVGRAYEFSTITGFAISFSGEDVSVSFESMDEHIHGVESGKEYKGLSTTPYHGPMFRSMDSVTITSLTIWYSC